MRYYVEIEMDNSAFEDAYGRTEVARILRELAGKVEQFEFGHDLAEFPVYDVNGNKVGKHGYTEIGL